MGLTKLDYFIFMCIQLDYKINEYARENGKHPGYVTVGSKWWEWINETFIDDNIHPLTELGILKVEKIVCRSCYEDNEYTYRGCKVLRCADEYALFVPPGQ